MADLHSQSKLAAKPQLKKKGELQHTQTLSECLNRHITYWSSGSMEQSKRQQSLIKMLIETGSPETLVDNKSFRQFVRVLDPKFKLPASGKLHKLLIQQYCNSKTAIKGMLSNVRKVTVCLDGWSAKGLASSYLGISVNFFNPVTHQPVHATLNLCQMPHPHTGAAIAEVLESCMEEWGISPTKVLLIVTDNGSNMVKAIKILQEKETEKYKQILRQSDVTADAEDLDSDPSNESDVDLDDSPNEYESEIGNGRDTDVNMENLAGESENVNDDSINDNDDEEELEESFDLPDYVPYRRMPCMAHTLQLVVHLAYKKYYTSIISKARRIVGQVRKSSVLVEKLVERCGKQLISDCTTRWNSTYQMARRLLDIKSDLNHVLSEAKIDTLLASEWVKLEEMANLLEPFSTTTDILQTDSQSMSYILPALLNLECHLQQFAGANAAAKGKGISRLMLSDFSSRFASILDPQSFQFNAIPVAACLLDHTVASVLVASHENQHLLEAAKSYIISQVLARMPVTSSAGSTVLSSSDNIVESHQIRSAMADDTETVTLHPALKRFKFIANKIQTSDTTAAASAVPTVSSIQSQLENYLAELQQHPSEEDALTFWKHRHASYSQLADLAEDLIAGPASQAYVERIFSLCGWLTAGRRNRLTKNLEMRVFLKLNAHLL